MLVKDVRKLTAKERFVYWIKERESIRSRKEAGRPKPWTDDEILQRYRFCNVVRMDDKVSRWLYENWYAPNIDHPNIVPAVALARFINQPSSLELVGFPHVWDDEYVEKGRRVLGRLWYDGKTVFNPAYIVRGNTGEDKVTSVFCTYTQPLIDDPPKIDRNSFRRTHITFLSYFGFGSFVAGQVTADLRHAMTGGWKDVMQWAPIGPGSKKGMNRYLGREVDTPITQVQFTSHLRTLIEEVRLQLPDHLAERMEAMDYQNCLCETDKFSRMILGEGGMRNRYPGV